MKTSILILPGWQDSGPEHWQSLWLKKFPNQEIQNFSPIPLEKLLKP